MKNLGPAFLVGAPSWFGRVVMHPARLFGGGAHGWVSGGDLPISLALEEYWATHHRRVGAHGGGCGWPRGE